MTTKGSDDKAPSGSLLSRAPYDWPFAGRYLRPSLTGAMVLIRIGAAWQRYRPHS